MKKTVPFSKDQAKEILSEYGSPLYIYDEKGIRRTAQDLKQAFGWAKSYRNYFAVKATPTPAILKLLAEEGMGFDCSSEAELRTVQRLGVTGEKIIFTANNVLKKDFELAIELGATVNIDDLTQLDVFLDLVKESGYHRVSCRYTPEDILGDGNFIMGSPRDAKYGMPLEHLKKAYTKLKTANIQNYSIHAMVVSNELDPKSFGITASLVYDAVKKIESEIGIDISVLNLGGGMGVDYSPEDQPIDLSEVSKEVESRLQGYTGEVHTEYGRYVTGPHGYLVTKVNYVMEKYKKYLGVDASMHNLMRPGMYGAYHQISVLDKSSGATETYDVVGSLCENNDKFAIDRELPISEPGDILVIHDAGAHGHAMGFNYNGLLRSAEVLLLSDGTHKLIRRAETLEDYFATIIW